MGHMGHMDQSPGLWSRQVRMTQLGGSLGSLATHAQDSRTRLTHTSPTGNIQKQPRPQPRRVPPHPKPSKVTKSDQECRKISKLDKIRKCQKQDKMSKKKNFLQWY
jgi:hypothetical protein